MGLRVGGHRRVRGLGSILGALFSKLRFRGVGFKGLGVKGLSV